MTERPRIARREPRSLAPEQLGQLTVSTPAVPLLVHAWILWEDGVEELVHAHAMQAALEAPLAAASVPVIYLPGPAIQRVSPLEFGHTDILIEGGYQAARSFLKDLDITGPGLYGQPWGRSGT
jgi:hypothetical protein